MAKLSDVEITEQLKALPGLTHTGRELIGQNFPQPQAKKSPTGTSTEGSADRKSVV